MTVGPEATGERSAALATLAEDYWQALLAANPIYATALGDRRYDDRLDDPSPAAKARLREDASAFRVRVDARPGALTTDDRVTRDALLAQLDGDAAILEADLTAWTVDPMDGPQAIAIMRESLQPVADPGAG